MMRMTFLFFVAAALFLAPARFARALDNPAHIADLPGIKADGSVLLPNQWSLRPAGKQVPLGDFPVNVAVHPDGRYAAVLHCGYSAHEIIIVDLKEAAVTARVPIKEAFYGLQFSHGGGRLYCSGASEELVHVFDFKAGQLTEIQPIQLHDPEERHIPCGIAVSTDARHMYVANVWGQRVSEIDLFARTNLHDIYFSSEAASATNAHIKYDIHASIDPDLEAITKRAEAQFDPTGPEAPFPYTCCLDEHRNRLYVSLWALATVAVVDLKSQAIIARWPTGDHPNEMLLTRSGKHLFVANANRNTVTIIDTSTGKPVETLYSSLSTVAPPGSTPNSLALAPDEKRLYVANACNNNIAVFDVSIIGKSRPLGFIPVGWYPTSVRITPDGRKLIVANGKGIVSKANPNGPQPGRRREGDTELISKLLPGTLSIIDLPRGGDFDRQLAAYTADAFLCTPQHSVPQVKPRPNNPIPAKLGDPSPIKYCIYIVKENRTYDQVLGDLPTGNGDSDLCIFPEKTTPNAHKIARDFVLFDNFYVDAEVSADGHEWSMGAYASDFVEKGWPMNYGHNRSRKFPFPAEGRFPVAFAPDGYIWDRAREAGISYRSYGEFVFDGKKPGEPGFARLPSLKGHLDPWYHCFDMDYSDLKRADRFITELKRMDEEGEMPRLQIIRLPNDHTAGTVPGKRTPTAYVAENDLALGRILEALGKTRFWPRCAVFIVEDDAQNGPDHVDAHRSLAFIVSPYARRKAVDSTMYSTSSLLHTMELILGLKPMTQFDAAATPFYNAFQPVPDLTPYAAEDARVDLEEKNTRYAWGSKASLKMDFSKEDAADDLALNEVIWRSVRGPNSPMPAPVRSAFVFTHPKVDDDDD